MKEQTEADVVLNIGAIHIEGLTLSRRDAEALKSSMQSELQRLITVDRFATRQQAANVPRTTAPVIQITPGQTPQSIGRAIAASVKGRMQR